MSGLGSRSGVPSSLRRRVLAEEPVCRHCHQPATQVDHITSRARIAAQMVGMPDDLIRAAQDLRESLQGLCASCHAKKTEQEFPGARAHFGAVWDAGKLRRSSPDPIEACPMCGGAMEFDHEFALNYVCGKRDVQPADVVRSVPISHRVCSWFAVISS
jgi:hypothetical protein